MFSVAAPSDCRFVMSALRQAGGNADFGVLAAPRQYLDRGDAPLRAAGRLAGVAPAAGYAAADTGVQDPAAGGQAACGLLAFICSS